MSISYSGCPARRGGLFRAILKQLRLVNLTPVTRIDINFDPFHERVTDTRNFLQYISSAKISATNPKCLLKTNIVCDHSEPTVTFSLQSGNKLVLKTANLTSLDILQLYNKHITSLIPPDPAVLQAAQELLEKKKKRKPPPKIKEGSKHRGIKI